MMQVGGTLGNIVAGLEMDRFKAHKVMIAGTLVTASVFAVAISVMNVELSGLMTLVFLLGYRWRPGATTKLKKWACLAAGIGIVRLPVEC